MASPSDASLDRFARAIARIDAANAEDPRRDADGLPRELVYSRRMTSWLDRLEPDASVALRLAARAQHLCRFRIPRSGYPGGRQAYLRWRRDCAELHARLATEILREVGYDEGTVARVADLLRKKDLAFDPEAMALEDAACLVFLEHELDDFASRQEEDSMVRILERTWRKMSPRGREAALGLDLPASARALIEKVVPPAAR